eukprot:7372305-Pyramimonas_sp.AAC.1
MALRPRGTRLARAHQAGGRASRPPETLGVCEAARLLHRRVLPRQGARHIVMGSGTLEGRRPGHCLLQTH